MIIYRANSYHVSVPKLGEYVVQLFNVEGSKKKAFKPTHGWATFKKMDPTGSNLRLVHKSLFSGVSDNDKLLIRLAVGRFFMELCDKHKVWGYHYNDQLEKQKVTKVKKKEKFFLHFISDNDEDIISALQELKEEELKKIKLEEAKESLFKVALKLKHSSCSISDVKGIIDKVYKKTALDE